jgi:hypothetical protein
MTNKRTTEKNIRERNGPQRVLLNMPSKRSPYLASVSLKAVITVITHCYLTVLPNMLCVCVCVCTYVHVCTYMWK